MYFFLPCSAGKVQNSKRKRSRRKSAGFSLDIVDKKFAMHPDVGGF